SRFRGGNAARDDVSVGAGSGRGVRELRPSRVAGAGRGDHARRCAGSRRRGFLPRGADAAGGSAARGGASDRLAALRNRPPPGGITIMHEPMNSHLPEPVRRVRRDPRRVLAAGLAASLLVHALVFLAFRFRVDIVPEPVQKPIPLVRVVPAIQVYDIREVPGVSTPIEVQILEQQAMDPLPVPALPEAAPEVAAEPEPSTIDALSVGERLRYRMAAPDVWRAPSEEIERPEMTDEERARARVAAQLGAFNDSVAAAAALAEKSMDWTVKDGEGGRWGVSPG